MKKIKVKKGSKRTLRWSEEQLQAHQRQCGIAQTNQALRPARTNKFNNKKVEIDGMTFDSGREAKRYQELRMLEAAGVISDLRLQVCYELAPSVVIRGRRKPPLRYFADFTYQDNGNLVVEDSKGNRDTSYIIKRHLMMSVHGIEITET